MENKKTLIIGATTNPSRYAYTAAHRIKNAGNSIVLLGKKKGFVADEEIKNSIEGINDIHTVSLYLSAKYQKEYENFLLKLKPQRVIFNPGTENPDLMQKLIENNIDAFEACNLVMLSTKQF